MSPIVPITIDTPLLETMTTRAEDREPCPYRIVDDAGGAFVFGTAGGLIWHSVGGARNAPRGEVMKQMVINSTAWI
jgi:hypothetical protein